MKRIFAAAVLAAGLAGPAQAEFLVTNITGGRVEFVLPSNNDFSADLTSAGYDFYFDDGIGLELTEGATIDFYAFASESGFRNAFGKSGSEAFQIDEEDPLAGGTPDINPVGINPFPGNLIASATFAAGTGANSLLQTLYFIVESGGPTPAGCDVGTGRCAIGTQSWVLFESNFAAWSAYDAGIVGTPTTWNAGDELVFGFDDDGAGPDDNHDDLIIVARIRSVIPEPATWGLMILGFAVLGLATRRRSAAVRA